ncbi:MAG: quinone-dependent dihydroorotate dehydrogenase [Sulfitobacter litoralis]|jgi:dihydroorotate dehydrogenase|uniref:Dihydroorotate dehydrogenase (quinone) n=2 Tax=root TaxID=1 RepID=A0A1H0S291_9RHOB|nr:MULTISPECIES: quinone-dependent dihydroorotate dehydrogenase [Sulfitobacter]MBQ0715649.1 quinone-dependent dihydroorotate dehydrogenase [Sulfitobacter litoralis]MBQ0766796.1 quinone-dependent dihydroorotate dehydrogenase [Sulfitobacter litoralis]MBQ0801453.1 quinone-dependent dihydroorotate dehydrogenase [Sulfitobacter litoralis]MCF7725214.1 quinone-dependent dihydroorotate dehydrogenase [Sulfitobacter sp. M22]MCF7776622.1 quinone-dependent dihydroorotate dehydrogenase [Sulfitobacter sp. M2
MKRMVEQLGLRALHQVDPETAHGLAITALRLGLAPAPGPVTSKRLKTSLAGMSLPNPVGLAAGFDKNATAVAPLSNAGFGFIEVGAATPLPQPGNDKPRLFRLTEDRAAINRFGFNNEGMQAICTRLARRGAGVPVGLNLGANKTSTDRAADFARVMELARDHVDFATVNVSSPNTEKLRDLQGKAALAALLAGVMEVRGDTPVFLKIAPDLTEAEIADVAEVANDADVAAIIATNTTLDRAGLKNAQRDQMGGLSGAPLFEKSTRVLARLSTLTDIPLVGVGGISSAEDAYAKICAGASAVQLYTALVYGGLSLASDIAKGIDKLLKQDGFDTVADAVGCNRSAWL